MKRRGQPRVCVGGERRSLTVLVDRIMTFILLLPPEKARLPDLYSLHDFIQTFFLSRHNDELERLQKEQRPGRPMNKHLGELKALIDNEMNEYREGMEVPDLCNETNVALLREWEGDPQALPTFRFVRVSGSDRYVSPLRSCLLTGLGRCAKSHSPARISCSKSSQHKKSVYNEIQVPLYKRRFMKQNVKVVPCT